MRYYPVYLDIQNKNCLVIGGGEVGTRKVKTLLRCGANVSVVAPGATEKLQRLADSGKITLKRRAYRTADLENVFLVIGATNDDQLNQKISKDAQGLNILCNIADRPAACNFILPSIVQRGDFVLTISTSGKSPALAKKIRKILERQFGEEYADLLQLMGAIRTKLLHQAHEPEVHKVLFERLVNSNLLDLIREGRNTEIDALLKEILGDGYDYESLMLCHS